MLAFSLFLQFLALPRRAFAWLCLLVHIHLVGMFHIILTILVLAVGLILGGACVS